MVAPPASGARGRQGKCLRWGCAALILIVTVTWTATAAAETVAGRGKRWDQETWPRSRIPPHFLVSNDPKAQWRGESACCGRRKKNREGACKSLGGHNAATFSYRLGQARVEPAVQNSLSTRPHPDLTLSVSAATAQYCPVRTHSEPVWWCQVRCSAVVVRCRIANCGAALSPAIAGDPFNRQSAHCLRPRDPGSSAN